MTTMVIWEDNSCCSADDYVTLYKDIKDDNYLVYQTEDFGRFPTYEEVYKQYIEEGEIVE